MSSELMEIMELAEKNAATILNISKEKIEQMIKK